MESHFFIESPSLSADDPSSSFSSRLSKRRERLRQKITEALQAWPEEDSQAIAWKVRSYPIVAVLAPVMSQHEGKIEFPGDPMCLYSALSYTVEQAVLSYHAGLADDSPYNDLCPRWGPSPNSEYRLSLTESTVRSLDTDLLNTDQTVFDPRVWNDRTRQYFVDRVLMVLRPAVVVISTVSPGHRYAIDIARSVRRHLPDTLIIFGGRHIDETMRFNDEMQKLELEHSSTLRAIEDGRIERICDLWISGQGYYALDILMKAISVAMDIENRILKIGDVIQCLRELLSRNEVPGNAVIVARDGSNVHIFPLRGPKIDLSRLPSPYRHFGIRAHFPIFLRADGSVQRTAHMMVTNSCPFHCNFCSEAVSVVGKLSMFEKEAIPAALERVYEYCSYGAEAIFFDDSVLWAGNIRSIQIFCQMLAQARNDAAHGRTIRSPWLRDDSTWRRLARLQWGAQFTAEYLTSLQSRAEALATLRALKEAGCTYIYMGIESLASEVMSTVHKNLQTRSDASWSSKVRAALEIAREADMRVGSSILFGLENETPQTIRETILGVARFIEEGLLWIASPNILTYHPATAITRLHEMHDKLDYNSLNVDNRAPYLYFEEAFPGVVSRTLSEDDIWYIHQETQRAWGKTRNLNPMQPTELPALQTGV